MLKRVLFVCVENSCRSQMAQGLAKAYGADRLEAYSAGSHPSGKVNPQAVQAMAAVGIDISDQRSKGFADLAVKEFDLAVTLGCGDRCPFVPADKHVHWDIPDPKGRESGFFCEVRDLIQRQIMELIND